ncbi:phage tail protein [Cryobacterium roopkundense]|uniref:phage tail protein n=1 Tax=Cryobacterium roopkundense TaxID=1001240 RepID=UPI000A00D5CD|nr:phage tail protein [Cryobacterium roopkundense]
MPYLASWVDLDWLTGPTPGGSGVDPARQRDLVANAADLSARRGTPAGLARFLQLATGVGGFGVVDDPGAFHVVVHIPADAAGQVDLVHRIVGVMKPAHITHDLVVDSAPPSLSDGSSHERE